ncbi:NRDE family protein [Streptomyces sp. NPDC021212]|uniref:NRDE family protein n=1 Tax=Streptomyces sp. NPDC021212 TaxID=3365118 RepID=UPI0037A7E0B4
MFFRTRPGWPSALLLGAVRDEFLDRQWKPPACHWGEPHKNFEGGLDLSAGGTWLALDRSQPAVAVLVNGVESTPQSPSGQRSRGECPLRALAGGFPLSRAEMLGMGGFHLLLGRLSGAELWSWDGQELRHQMVLPGDHVLTFYGLDDRNHRRAAGVLQGLKATADASPRPGERTDEAWGDWLDLFGDGEPADCNPQSPLVSRILDGRTYGSTSASLIALTSEHSRFDFTGDPWQRTYWYEI